MTLDAASLLAAWPLVLLALTLAAIVGPAFVRAGRPRRRRAGLGATGSDTGRTCRTAGHHYLKDATGWCCSHCGDEIRQPGHETHRHGAREAVAV
ncbi:hypothetical protein GCM10009868_02210 [Terrabacter aerolatus]|uniref:Uncharacterized protein n=2 Tax=Terrabacter aerolatus TaxID=422442 RepID=A0A512D2G2_9MICO|nr:hypothetical protein TAE01_24720 [Terrabacter aerolatus]